MRMKIAFVAVIALAVTGISQAHQHYGLAHKIKGKGVYPILSTPHGHTATAHVNNKGKVQHLSVSHNRHTAAQLKLKKVKTNQRRHAMGQTPENHFGQADQDQHHFISTDPQVTVWVGWAFFNPTANQWIYIWFPITLVEGGDQGTENIDGNN